MGVARWVTKQVETRTNHAIALEKMSKTIIKIMNSRVFLIIKEDDKLEEIWFYQIKKRKEKKRSGYLQDTLLSLHLESWRTRIFSPFYVFLYCSKLCLIDIQTKVRTIPVAK